MRYLTRDLFRWERPYVKQMLALAIPIILQNLVGSSLHIVDGLMIAGLGEAPYAGVIQAGNYSFLFNLLLFGAASGTGLYFSQFWGARDEDGIRQVMALCLRLTIAFAGAFALGALLFPDQVMGLYLPVGESRNHAVAYITTVFPQYLIAAIDFVFVVYLRSTERAVVPMLSAAAAFSTNTFLNWCLIYGKFGLPQMGVRGAALATVLSAIVSLVINVAYIRAKKLPVAIRPRDLIVRDRAFARQYIKKVLPVILNEGLWALGIAMYAMFVGTMGNAAVAAWGVSRTIDQVVLALAFGIINAAAVMIGKSIGAGRIAEAKLTTRRMSLTSIVTGLVMGLLLIALRFKALSFFSDLSQEALASAADILLITGSMMWMRNFVSLVIVGILRAGGDTHFSMALDAGVVWALGVPLMAVAVFVLKLPIALCYLMSMLEEFAKLAIAIPRLKSGKWIHRVTRDNLPPDEAAIATEGGAL